MTSNALLAKRTVTLDFSGYSRDENRSQYAPLKITCIKEVTYFFLKNQVITCTLNSPNRSSSPYKKQ